MSEELSFLSWGSSQLIVLVEMAYSTIIFEHIVVKRLFRAAICRRDFGYVVTEMLILSIFRTLFMVT